MNLPVVRIELEGMKQTIIRAFTEESLKLDADVEAAIHSAIKNFNIQRVIQVEAEEILARNIREQLDGAVRSLMWDEDIRALLKRKLLQALKK